MHMCVEKFYEICVVIPAYNRTTELQELLESIANQQVMPASVLVVEDDSPERKNIATICRAWKEKFSLVGVELKYVENPVNLGFDANVRQCLDLCEQRWALLMGNDDLLLPNAIDAVRDFVMNHPVMMVSRSFIRFDKDISRPLGVSSLSKEDMIYRAGFSDPKYLFRCSAFIGGLVLDTFECKKIATLKYDGSLYYQIYLAAVAFCTTGIGYISQPTVGGRAGNPPMFGSAKNEVGVHIPGSYTANSRRAMWKGVLHIAKDIGNEFDFDLYTQIKKELTIRQSFHIFEMNVSATKDELLRLRAMLVSLDLYSHWLPKVFFTINYIAGRRADFIYAAVRYVFQR